MATSASKYGPASAFEDLSAGAVTRLFRAEARSVAVEWTPSLENIVQRCATEPGLFAFVRRKVSSPEEYARAWLSQYGDADKKRVAQRVSAGVGTLPDPVVTAILRELLGSDDRAQTCVDAHRVAMEAENLVGELLEEYIELELKEYGWDRCLGNTVQSVDFIDRKGDLLQVKNRSNSENSSSARVREGTSIRKWYRIEAITGKTHWDALQDTTGSTRVSERGFQAFAARQLRLNSDAIRVPERLPKGLKG